MISAAGQALTSRIGSNGLAGNGNVGWAVMETEAEAHWADRGE
jgi:hypothetical protein